jgi:hypothetical protein
MTQDYLGTYAQHVYEIVRLETLDMDAIYKDYILQLVGVFGFNSLIENKLIERCGVVNGRRLYTLLKNDTIFTNK